jgi:hypothetical protein
MWFLFGFVTLGAACVSSFLWRRNASWHGTSATADGIGYEYSVSTSKGRVTGAKVGVACAEGFTFSLRHEEMFDLWSKGIGLTKECQTGDLDFDRDIYILSDDPVVHRMLQFDGDLRADIQRVFKDCRDGLGAPRAIYVHGGRLWITAKPREKKSAAAAADCPAVVAALSAVASRLERGGAGLHDDRDPFPRRAACILAVSTGLSINGAIELFHMVAGNFPVLGDADAPLGVALAIGFAIVLALAAIALQLMGRSARTHLVLLELLVSGGFGATVSAYAELRDYDIDYDTAPVRMVETTVAGKHTSHSRHRTHYHVELGAWPAPGQSKDIEVYSGFYDSISPGSRVVVEEHPGALGWVWTSGLRSE